MRLAPQNLFLLPLLALPLMTGCTGWAPQGYYHLYEEYKAPPGPTAHKIGYSYEAVANAAVAQQWRAICAALVDRMQGKMGIAPQNVYVKMLPDQNAYNAAFDYTLREELRSRGYTLVNSPLNVLTIEPRAMRPNQWQINQEPKVYNDDVTSSHMAGYWQLPKGKFDLTLIVSRNGTPVGEAERSFNAPAYGYVPGTGIDRASALELEAADPAPANQPPRQAPQNIVPEPVEQEDIRNTSPHGSW